MAIKELVTATCNLITGLQTPNSPKSQSSNQSTRAAQSDVSMTPPGGGGRGVFSSQLYTVKQT